MTLILDTRHIPLTERVDVVRETIARAVVHVDIDFPAERGPAAVYGAITDLGPVRVCSVRSNATRVERTPTFARDALPPSIFLGVQIAGSSLIVQGGREAVLRPGDLAFSDSTAATGNANVKALVYIDAYIPQQGDTVNALTGAEPGSVLHVPDPTTVFNLVKLHDPLDATKVIGVDLYVKPSLFPSYFAAGVRANKAALLAAGQRPLSASALDEPSPNVPAWKTIPSWDLIGTADRVIPPAEQEIMADRAGSHVVKVKAPHLSMVSDPCAVTDLITTAAAHS